MSQPAAGWDVEQYERYKAYRDRPALDLMVQLPAELAPHEIWDLGCGTGEHAAILARRHPGARVHGLDSSPSMLEAARARNVGVTWLQGDIDAFEPEVPPELIFTNAALHWLPDHERLLPRLVSTLAPGGVFACQVPVTWAESWHVDLRETAHDGPWAEKMVGVRDVQPVASAEDYWRWLSPLAEVDIWKARYLHVLTGEDPVVDWMMGTGLRPYLARLPDPAEREAFLADYRDRTRRSFPQEADGSTLFDFPRLFMVARRR